MLNLMLFIHNLQLDPPLGLLRIKIQLFKDSGAENQLGKKIRACSWGKRALS
jgi:hypothetical protein